MVDIEVFTTPSCPYCGKVKQWLDENGYDYEEHNVAENQEKAKEMIQRTGQKGVPQVFVGDDEVVGFRPDKLEKIIERNE